MHKISKALGKKLDAIPLNPPLVLLIGFAILILSGAILLNLPQVTRDGHSIGFINALFTAGSASCVTGLVVVNTGQTFNLAGQIIILLLIQAGGLGIMTLATIIPIFLGKKIGLVSRQILKEQLNLESFSGVVRLLRYVVAFTLTVELIGSLILATRLIPLYGPRLGSWYSIFHSISAFCNAGFDVMGDSIYPLRGDLVVNFTIMALVVVGGLGFLVNKEIFKFKNPKKLSTQAKIVLVTSFLLILGGTLIFFLLEYSNPATLAGEKSFQVKANQALFQSVISRTAGFYSVPLAGLRDSTSFLLIILMFIGGSPGSTAGGLKTTTFAVLALTSLSTLRGQEEPIVFRRHIPIRTIRKALSLVVVSLALVIMVAFILTITEQQKFIDLVFETVSAYGTVGLSKGITPELSAAGKLMITLTMYAGRVGPLTLGFAIGNRQKIAKIRYAGANISVG